MVVWGKAFYIILSGLGIGVIGGMFDNSFLIYLACIILIIGSLLIPKLDEENRRQEPNKTYEDDKVLEAEVHEVLTNKKHLNKK